MRNSILMLLVAACLAPASANAQSTDVAASDFDGSGRVDFVDFLDFAAAFGKASGTEGFDTKFDLDGSGIVDFGDFLIFAGHFGDSTTTVATTYLYVSDIINNRVEVVDLGTNLAIPSRSFSVDFPRGMARGAQTGLLYIATLDSLVVYNDEGLFAFAVPLTPYENPDNGVTSPPSAFKVRLNAAETVAYVSETASGAVEVIDLLTRQSTAVIPVGFNPGNMVLSPDETQLYVGIREDHIAIVDVAQAAKVDSIVTGSLAINKLALSADGNTLYAATATPDSNHASGSLIRLVSIDRATKTVTDSIQISDVSDLVDQVQEIAVNPVTNTLLVSFFRTAPAAAGSVDFAEFVGELLVLSLPSLEIASKVSIGESSAGFGISPDGRTAYVAGSEELSSGITRIFVVDLETGLRASQLPIAIQSATEFIFQSTKQALAALSTGFEFAFGF